MVAIPDDARVYQYGMILEETRTTVVTVRVQARDEDEARQLCQEVFRAKCKGAVEPEDVGLDGFQDWDTVRLQPAGFEVVGGKPMAYSVEHYSADIDVTVNGEDRHLIPEKFYDDPAQMKLF